MACIEDRRNSCSIIGVKPGWKKVCVCHLSIYRLIKGIKIGTSGKFRCGCGCLVS